MSLAGLVEHIGSFRPGALSAELEELQAIRSWALTTVVGFDQGAEVEIVEAPDCQNGWWPYREALVAGAHAYVESVTFSVGRQAWYATIVLRREWWTDDDGLRRVWSGPAEDAPAGMEAPHPHGRKHSFALLATRLKRVDPLDETANVTSDA